MIAPTAMVFVQARSVQTERINPFFQWRINAGADTVIASARPKGSGKIATHGTGKPVPYKARRKTQHRTNVTRNSTVFSVPSNRVTAITVSVAASIRL